MVIPPNDMIFNCILSDLFSRSPQQRANNHSILWLHAFQSVEACAAQQVDEESLSLVVGMMGHGDSIITQLLPQFFKPRIAQVAGSHLDGNSVFFGIFLSIEMLYKAMNTILFRKLANKFLIAIGFLSTQMKIAMCRDKLHLGFQQQIRQNHRIDAAAEGKNDFVTLGNQVIPINICLELFEHGHFFFFTEKPKPPIFSPRP